MKRTFRLDEGRPWRSGISSASLIDERKLFLGTGAVKFPAKTNAAANHDHARSWTRRRRDAARAESCSAGSGESSIKSYCFEAVDLIPVRGHVFANGSCDVAVA